MRIKKAFSMIACAMLIVITSCVTVHAAEQINGDSLYSEDNGIMPLASFDVSVEDLKPNPDKPEKFFCNSSTYQVQ